MATRLMNYDLDFMSEKYSPTQILSATHGQAYHDRYYYDSVLC